MMKHLPKYLPSFLPLELFPRTDVETRNHGFFPWTPQHSSMQFQEALNR